ncbi:MAG: hypothetical protein ACYTGR_04390 [Planctomycetota bacterium]|jgi:hypothetical protein
MSIPTIHGVALAALTAGTLALGQSVSDPAGPITTNGAALVNAGPQATTHDVSTMPRDPRTTSIAPDPRDVRGVIRSGGDADDDDALIAALIARIRQLEAALGEARQDPDTRPAGREPIAIGGGSGGGGAWVGPRSDRVGTGGRGGGWTGPRAGGGLGGGGRAAPPTPARVAVGVPAPPAPGTGSPPAVAAPSPLATPAPPAPPAPRAAVVPSGVGRALPVDDRTHGRLIVEITALRSEVAELRQLIIELNDRLDG